MKKTLLVILISLFSFQGFAQDADLYQTWYYLSQEADLGDMGDFVWDIEPPITPYITITESLEFNGFGACNSFSGNFIYTNDSSGERLTVVDYTRTYETCNFQQHIDFEIYFLNYFAAGTYSLGLWETPFDQYLALETIPGFFYHFRNSPILSAPNNDLNNLALYPNPVSDQLFISSENTVIESISIYTLTGKKVAEVVNQTNSIDVSKLSNGMFFIVISSESGKFIKKFIKK